jgi:hypothetical protein
VQIEGSYLGAYLCGGRVAGPTANLRRRYCEVARVDNGQVGGIDQARQHDSAKATEAGTCIAGRASVDGKSFSVTASGPLALALGAKLPNGEGHYLSCYPYR